MKLTLIGMVLAALALGVNHASADGGGQTVDGAPIQLQSLQQHVRGLPVAAQLMTVALHEMNVRGFQPVGLWVSYFVLPDSSTGNANVCAQWYNQVLADENAQTQESKTRAWLEVHVTEEGSPIVSDEGNPMIADAAINCWEALELK